jgi:hypothetical protein
MPTAVITESMEKTASRTTICTMTCHRTAPVGAVDAGRLLALLTVSSNFILRHQPFG